MSPTPRSGAPTVGAAVWEALAEVRDPEIDEPLTELGFVASCAVAEDGTATVHLRLPTYFCAPNFAYLMAADAHAAVRGVPGVRQAEVVLDGHFAAEAINVGVAEGRGFVGTFGDLAAAELDQLRVDFWRRSLLAATDRACRELATAGVAVAATTRLADVPAVAGIERLRRLRRQLGHPVGEDDPLVVDPVAGTAVAAADFDAHLRRARLTRVGADANAEICRGLLRAGGGEQPVAVRPRPALTAR